MSVHPTAPLSYDLALRCGVEDAFATYVERIGEWWDPRYTANGRTLEAVTIEPYVGGRVYATHGDLGEHDWGVVTVWEPPHRLAHTFTLAQDPGHPSEVSVEFAAAGAPGAALASTVRFAHGGWTEHNVAVRKKFGDWSVILDRFSRLAESGG